MLLRWRTATAEITDRSALRIRLDELSSASSPLIAYLNGASGALGIGLGHPDGALLLFAPNNRSEVPLHSLGDPNAQGTVRLDSNGASYDFAARCLISQTLAQEAAEAFLDTDRLPECITWEPEPKHLDA